MAHELVIGRDGLVIRRDFADHALGDAQREANRARVAAGKARDGNDPLNEAFTFSMDEWELMKKTHPQLHDRDQRRQARAWRAFAQSSEGRAFRVR